MCLSLLPASRRTYALSRFPTRPVTGARWRLRPPPNPPRENQPSADESLLWHTSGRPPTSRQAEGLRTLLLHNNTLIIERQIEMLNIFVGFEQSNKYSISNESGEALGFIVEESHSFLSVMARQAFATHRPFRAIIMDAEGSPVLWLRRPFAWINSRMFVQRLKDLTEYTGDGEPILDTFGEVKQVWHPWRRRYDLFIREGPTRALSTVSDPQPEPSLSTLTQFGRVDSPLLAWHFHIIDGNGQEVAYINRAFRGFGREIFTDTGQYYVNFSPSHDALANGQLPVVNGDLTLDERALVLALAVNIDFDYFSRHSGSGGVVHMSHWE